MFNRFLGIATMVAGIVTALPAFAGDITISDAWAKESIGRVPNGAAFFIIHNAGAADKIVGATSDLADRTELHTHIMENNVMKMRRVEGGVDVPASGELAFKPGSYHVMFLDLHTPLKAGQHIPLTLQFEKAGDVPVDVDVISMSDASQKQHAPMTMDMNSGMGGAMGQSGGMMGQPKN
ncbi:copper chaperone PCu(A)C [Thalassospira mesophila]|uniref:copper chaperone PCu(A)C n=1 Tax=Thalassospira mesophila TaxID=1293891 RepID=UPI001FE406F8|nr:copper chaperone PCu(A)C [Thalassospira mesophila]